VTQGGIGCLIFDSDGTLVDTLHLIVEAFNYAAEPVLGKRFDEADVSALLGPTMKRIFTNLLPPDAVNDAVDRYHRFYRQHFHEYARVYPDVLELLTAIQKSGRKLGVLTGAGRIAAESTMQFARLSEFFTTLVTGDDVDHPKPDPQGLLMAISKTGVTPDKTVYVGDSVVDLETARRAGARSGAALWGSRHPNELSLWRPDFIFREPSQITETITDERID
jgi:HAD superfamily hydrolase (TIGR01509 family)